MIERPRCLPIYCGYGRDAGYLKSGKESDQSPALAPPIDNASGQFARRVAGRRFPGSIGTFQRTPRQIQSAPGLYS